MSHIHVLTLAGRLGLALALSLAWLGSAVSTAAAHPSTFAAHVDFVTGADPVSAAAADLNGDGVHDLGDEEMLARLLGLNEVRSKE